jgi:hypothetical protein
MRRSPVLFKGLEAVMKRLLLLLVLVCVPALQAQEREIERAGLDRDVADRLIGLYQHPGTLRFDGPGLIAAGDVVARNVAVMGGDLVVAGRVEGEVVVVHGDLRFEPGGAVTGDITIVGGEVHGAEQGQVGGTLIAYGEGFRFIRRGDRDRVVHASRRPRPRMEGDVGFGYSRLAVRLGHNYNRVEGLPIHIGPVIETGGRAPLRLEAMAILRTEDAGEFGPDRIGYTARLEQFIGGRQFRVGVGARSTVEPIESWGLSDLENSLSTFLFHSDHRDHYEQRGWQAYARYAPGRLPFDATVEFRADRHGSVAAGDPWALFGGGEWRLQPLVAEGAIRSVGGQLRLDTRDDRQDPLEGWLASARILHALAADLEVPASAQLPLPLFPPAAWPAFDGGFTTGFLDVRRYNPVGRGSRLNLRGLAGGSLAGGGLPPQYQHALGGIGSLPAFGRMSADCGARDTRVTVSDGSESATFHPYYGCDRVALFQAEYRGHLSFHFDLGGREEWSSRRRRDWDWDGDFSPSWVVFFNAGRGWAEQKEWGPLERTDTPTLADAGVGFLIGDLGIYWAAPLTAGGSSNFFVRLGRRF